MTPLETGDEFTLQLKFLQKYPLISNIIQKITNQFAHHLREDGNTSDESIELIKKIFQLKTSTEEFIGVGNRDFGGL